MGRILFFHELLASKKVEAPKWAGARAREYAEDFLGFLRKNAERVVRFDVQNVADHYYNGTDQAEWDVYTDFPCLAPPYPLFWMEYQQPPTFREGPRVVEHGIAFGVGVLVAARTAAALRKSGPRTVSEYRARLEAEAAQYIAHLDPTQAAVQRLSREQLAELLRLEAADRFAAGMAMGLTRVQVHVFNLTHAHRESDEVIAKALEAGTLQLPAQTAWELECTLCLFQKSQPPLAPVVIARFNVQEDGAMVPHLYRVATVRGDHKPLPTGPIQTAIESLANLFKPAFMALTFLHCKNVEAVGHEPPLQARQAWQKRHHGPGQADLRYKVLKVEPMVQKIREAKPTTGNGRPRPLHECRAHFGDYRKGKGLFGKHKGLFWFEAHTRGNPEVGEVMKDYAVSSGKSPTEEAEGDNI